MHFGDYLPLPVGYNIRSFMLRYWWPMRVENNAILTNQHHGDAYEKRIFMYAPEAHNSD